MRSNIVLIFSLLLLLGHGKKSDGNGKGKLEILTILQITNHSFPECGSKRPKCYPVDCDKPPKYILIPTVINSPHSQEFMVSRIFLLGLILLLAPLMDEFTLMEVF